MRVFISAVLVAFSLLQVSISQAQNANAANPPTSSSAKRKPMTEFLIRNFNVGRENVVKELKKDVFKKGKIAICSVQFTPGKEITKKNWIFRNETIWVPGTYHITKNNSKLPKAYKGPELGDLQVDLFGKINNLQECQLPFYLPVCRVDTNKDGQIHILRNEVPFSDDFDPELETALLAANDSFVDMGICEDSGLKKLTDYFATLEGQKVKQGAQGENGITTEEVETPEEFLK